MQGRLLAQLVLIVILSAILKQCSDSFQGEKRGRNGILCLLHGIDCGDSDLVLQHFAISCGADARTMWVFGAMVPIFLVLCFIGEFGAGGSDGADADGRRDGTFRWHQLC